MLTRKAPVITYKDSLQNILAFVENDEMEDESDPLFENQSGDDGREICRRKFDRRWGGSTEQEEELNPRRNRKLLTRNWMVHDINPALDKNNYDPIHDINGNGHWETLTGYLGPKTDKKTETITWTSTLPSQSLNKYHVWRVPLEMSLLGKTALTSFSAMTCSNRLLQILTRGLMNT